MWFSSFRKNILILFLSSRQPPESFGSFHWRHQDEPPTGCPVRQKGKVRLILLPLYYQPLKATKTSQSWLQKKKARFELVLFYGAASTSRCRSPTRPSEIATEQSASTRTLRSPTSGGGWHTGIFPVMVTGLMLLGEKQAAQTHREGFFAGAVQPHIFTNSKEHWGHCLHFCWGLHN